MTSFWLPDETGFSYRNGALFCEDVPVTELADKYGTPSFIYSRKAIETAFRDYDGAFGSHPHHILYSVKACSNIGIISLAREARFRVRHRVGRRTPARGGRGRRPVEGRLFRRRQDR